MDKPYQCLNLTKSIGEVDYIGKHNKISFVWKPQNFKQVSFNSETKYNFFYMKQISETKYNKFATEI